ncbi:MAG: glycoside hydrolase family 27 protein [Propionibacteriaceae bacterium]|jgi:hypothetical protein|nr:glycoside hydrolase family 27 protein [Propionibacteriaceae bacterium]
MALVKAAAPPLGWNSWDCFGTSVTEAEVLANAEFMAGRLLEFGWDTVVIDADWSDPGAKAHGYNQRADLALDGYGRLLPTPVRFPSAGDGRGFRALADRVHSLGLKFGLHIMRGLPRLAVERNTPILGTAYHAADIADPANLCDWNPHMVGVDCAHPAAQAYYDSLFALYADWGADFVKADDLLWPYQAADIAAIAEAVRRAPRDIVLSLSCGRDLSLAWLEHLRANSTMWRISDDMWDHWSDLEANLGRLARWAPHAGPGGWPDADMIPLGHIGLRSDRDEPRDDRFTPAERVTLMTAWLIGRSPLFLGGDLPTTDPATIALFTNAAALAVGRESARNREVLREGPLVLWAADGPGARRYAAAFNLGLEVLDVVLDTRAVGFPARVAGSVTEVWTGVTVGAEPVAVQDARAAYGVAPGSSALRWRLEPHGAALLVYRP